MRATFNNNIMNLIGLFEHIVTKNAPLKFKHISYPPYKHMGYVASLVKKLYYQS